MSPTLWYRVEGRVQKRMSPVCEVRSCPMKVALLVILLSIESVRPALWVEGRNLLLPNVSTTCMAAFDRPVVLLMKWRLQTSCVSALLFVATSSLSFPRLASLL